MSEQEAPKITFPCDYPIKVMGVASQEFRDHVMTIMERHSDGFDRQTATIRDSRNGRFQSVNVTIIATGEAQLQAIFVDLKTSSLVQMVL